MLCKASESKPFQLGSCTAKLPLTKVIFLFRTHSAQYNIFLSKYKINFWSETFKDCALHVEPYPDIFDDGLHTVCDVMLHELLTDLLRIILLNQNNSKSISQLFANHILKMVEENVWIGFKNKMESSSINWPTVQNAVYFYSQP